MQGFVSFVEEQGQDCFTRRGLEGNFCGRFNTHWNIIKILQTEIINHHQM